ncbi:MAG: tetratricopeptide repeat protein, partial [Pseudomonadota bacterium]
ATGRSPLKPLKCHAIILRDTVAAHVQQADVVPQDYGMAFQWFERAAAGGLPDGMRNLAAMYANGFGTEIDEARSDALLRQAALGGDIESVSFFSDARLQPADPALTEAYATAAALGDPIASFNHGLVAIWDDAATGQAYRTSADAFRVAAQDGIPAAMANLGILMFEGRGILQNYTEGYAWLTVAVSMGLTDALDLRDRLGATMTVGQLNAAERRAEEIWESVTGTAP